MIFPAPIWTDPQGRVRRPEVSSGFGEMRRYRGRDGVMRRYPHSGVDILYRARAGDPPIGPRGSYTEARSPHYYCPAGLPCLAIDEGEIDWMGSYRSGGVGTGLAITLRLASGDIVLYAHLLGYDVDGVRLPAYSASVHKGQAVHEGQALAEIGGSPAPGPHLRHLHLEIWLGGDQHRRTDPVDYLRRGKARYVATPENWAPRF